MCLLLFWTRCAFFINHSHWQKNVFCFSCLIFLPILIPTASSKTEPYGNTLIVTFNNRRPLHHESIMKGHTHIWFSFVFYQLLILGTYVDCLTVNGNKGNTEKWM